jgi:hypothetical protein
VNEFDGEEEFISTDKFGKSSGRWLKFFAVALVAAVIFAAILIFGPVRTATGGFLADIWSAAKRTFSPSSGGVLVGEIPLGGSADILTAGSSTAAIRDNNASVAKVVAPKKAVVADSRDRLISEMNNKINELQAKLDAAALGIATSQAANPVPTSQVQPQAEVFPQPVVAPAIVPIPSGQGRVLVSEIVAGADGNSNYEFIELYNAGSAAVDLTGWSVKKKSSTGSESSLVAASRLSGKIIQPGKHFLLGNETGYQGSTALDVPWPSSYTLAYTNNSVVLYNNGVKVEEIFWAEIPKGQSFVRSGWESVHFILSVSPTPQNSRSR